MARMVATKASLSIRVDALTDADGKSEPTAPTIGLENRAKLESRLRALQHQDDLGAVRSFGVSPQKQQKYTPAGETKTYNTAADAVVIFDGLPRVPLLPTYYNSSDSGLWLAN